jgi:hypothetical protein
MASIAADALPVLALLAPAFTPPTFQRAQLLAVAAILTTGRRTVSNLLRTLGHLAAGAPSGYHRVQSEARWSGLCLAALLTRFLLRRYWPAGIVTLVGDDTVSAQPGRKVYGKARANRIKVPRIVGDRLISSRGRTCDSPRIAPFTEENDDHLTPLHSQALRLSQGPPRLNRRLIAGRSA